MPDSQKRFCDCCITERQKAQQKKASAKYYLKMKAIRTLNEEASMRRIAREIRTLERNEYIE